jgi:CheY-like chemotaxis protein
MNQRHDLRNDLATAARNSTARAQPEDPTVVLAEEDWEDRERLSDVLSRDGYHVVVVEDGFELLDYLSLVEEGAVRPPDVIVSDVELSGCDGLTACRAAVRQMPEVQIVLLAPPGEEAGAERAGVDEVVAKPVDEVELSGTVALLAH